MADQADSSSSKRKRVSFEAAESAEAPLHAAAPVEPLDFFKTMHLRKIVKENHGGSIDDVSLCTESGMQNLVVTIGQSQINVYDNNHFGNHLDLFLHYIHPDATKEKKSVRGTFCRKNGHSRSQGLTACTWIGSCKASPILPAEDVYLAFGTASGEIYVISAAFVRVIRFLEGVCLAGVGFSSPRLSIEVSLLACCRSQGGDP